MAQSIDYPQLETIPARKIGRSRKAPALKTQVIIKRSQGQDKTSIGKDLGIARNTVTRIIEECDVERHIEANRSASLDLIPESIRVAKYRLSQNSENMAIKVLENTIWPLNAKQGKAPEPGLTIAIQNLMQVQPNQPVKQETSIDVSPAAADTKGQAQE
jgi:hypothetical protein